MRRIARVLEATRRCMVVSANPAVVRGLLAADLPELVGDEVGDRVIQLQLVAGQLVFDALG